MLPNVSTLAVPLPSSPAASPIAPCLSLPYDQTPSKTPKALPQNVYTINGVRHTLNTNASVPIYTPAGTCITACPDSGGSVNLVSSQVLKHHFPSVDVQTSLFTIALSGIGVGPQTNIIANLPIEFRDADFNSICFTAPAFVVDNLACGILLGAGFLKRHNLNLVWADEDIAYDHIKWKDRKIPLVMRRDPPRRIRQCKVYATESMIVKAGQGYNVKVSHRPLPSAVHGYFFEPIPRMDLARREFGSAVRSITTNNPERVPFANFGDTDIKIIQGLHIGTLSPAIPTADCAEVNLGLTEIFEGLPPMQEQPEGKWPDGHPYIVHPVTGDEMLQEGIDLSKVEISDHWGAEVQQQFLQVIKNNSYLFRNGLGCFNDGIEMPIPFKEGVSLKDLKQPAYNLSMKDRMAMNGLLDPLREAGIVEPVPLGQPSPVSSPAFVVWRDGKPRVVVDLRRVNSKMHTDAYPLPRQDTILSTMGGASVFSILDMTKSFFQQRIKPQDRWKTAFVTPHRGQEQLTVSTMGLCSSPGFFQHRMELLFGKYLWKFVLVYIDDIIVFSTSVQAHIKDLAIALNVLKSSGVTLQLSKCRFAQPGIKALGHWVDRLGLSTMDEKVEKVRTIKFPESLQQLENGLGFFGYYRKFVKNYAGIVRPLQVLKTRGFKGSPPDKKGRRHFASNSAVIHTGVTDIEIKQAKDAWEQIKDCLYKAPVLAFPDFNKPFILYVDGSKEMGFGAALHQIGADGLEHPILYLSKELSPAEASYWPTELETGALVWALQKLPQYFDGGKTTVWTDHSALKDVLSLASVHSKCSLRLANWRLFLSKFAPYMEIKHRPGKSHANADGLSRIHTDQTSLPQSTNLCINYVAYPVTTRRITRQHEPSATSNRPQTNTVDMETPPSELQQVSEEQLELAPRLTISVMQADPELIQSIVRELPRDKGFSKIYQQLRQDFNNTKGDVEGPITTLHNFRLDPKSKLLYFQDDGNERLCIPHKCYLKIFRMAHDRRAHAGCYRLHEFLHEFLFFPNMKRELATYTACCPVCDAGKPKRTLPWGSLEPIDHPLTPLSVLCIDFIDGFPVSKQDHDKILLVTCKASKYVEWIVGKQSDTAENWANLYFKKIYCKWGFPDMVISDQDSKFTSAFWRRMFELSGTKLSFTTAHHSAGNGQAERSNQTFIHALRCAIAGRYDQSDWEDLLPEIQLALNSSVNSTTGVTPFMYLYGRQPKTSLAVPNSTDPNWLLHRDDLRKSAMDAVQVAQAKMKIDFDKHHVRPQFTGSVYLRISHSAEKGYHLQNHNKLRLPTVGPCRIIRPHGNLAYEVELPKWLTGINPIISVEFLEPAKNDPYKRMLPPPGPITVDGEERYVIEHILGKESRRVKGKRVPFYLVKWLGYEEPSWEPADAIQSQVPLLVKEFESQRRPL